MNKIFPTFIVILQFFNLSSPAAIRPKFQNIQDFQHCLVTYLNTIGIIQFTNSQNDENSAINCENFHIDLKSSIENMYKLIKLNLYEALGDDGEAECMDEVFRYTKFMEYNVIATTAVQLKPNGFQELKNLLHISKNIFIYATMKCLITNDMISELFQHFAHQIQVDDHQFSCVVQHVSENKLMEDFMVENLDEFLSEKFMESSEETQAFTNNLQQNMQYVDKNSIHNSAETATNIIGTNFNELTTITSTQMANLLDIPPTGSEIRETIVDLNELGLNFNEKVENKGSYEVNQANDLRIVDETTENLMDNGFEEKYYTTSHQNLLHTTESTEPLELPSVTSTTTPSIEYSDLKIAHSTQLVSSNDLITTENIPSQMSTVMPEIISTKLRKIENFNEPKTFEDDPKLKPIETIEDQGINGSDYQTITSKIENKSTDDDDVDDDDDDDDDDDADDDENNKNDDDDDVAVVDDDDDSNDKNDDVNDVDDDDDGDGDDELRSNNSTLNALPIEPTLNDSEKSSTTARTSETENFDHPPNYRVSTTEQMNTSENVADDLTPTASLLRSESFTDESFTSSDDPTTENTQNLNKVSNFSEKFESFADNLKNNEDTAIAPKKVMILERPAARHIQKIERPKPKKDVKPEGITQYVRNIENEGDEKNVKDEHDLIVSTTNNALGQENGNRPEHTIAGYIPDQNIIEEMTKVAKEIMESNEDEQPSVESQESSTKSVTNFKNMTLEAELMKIRSKVDPEPSKNSQEVTEFVKSYEHVSETSRTSAETSERSKEFNKNGEGIEDISRLSGNSTEPTEDTEISAETSDNDMQSDMNPHKSTTPKNDDQDKVSTEYENLQEYSAFESYQDESKENKSDEDQVEASQTTEDGLNTTEPTVFTSEKPEESFEGSKSEEIADKIGNLNEKPFTITEGFQNIEDQTTDSSNIHQNLQDIVKSGDKKGKIVFKISNLPKNFYKLASKLLNDTKNVVKNDENFPGNSTILDEIKEANLIIDDSNLKIDGFNLKSDDSNLKIDDSNLKSDDRDHENDQNIESNLNNIESTTTFDNSQEKLQQSSEILQASSENSFQKLAAALRNRQNSKKAEIFIPDSRIKRHASSKPQSCPSTIENLKQKIKNFNLESIDEELNSCMSQLVSPHDIDDYFVFIVLKKYGSTELQANEKNKKLMNMIMSFIGKYIECTDLYGFMEMAGFPQSDDGYY